MAIYRLEKKSISRGNNHNLVAAVAYRAGAKFTDKNSLNHKAAIHDYTKKMDVAHTKILLPDELAVQMDDAGLTLNFEEIANLVEKGETTLRGKMKMGAKLANEYVLAGSHELSLEENIAAFQEFARQQSEEQNVIAMVFVHDPKHGDDMSADSQAADSSKSKDPRNIHAHIVLLSRQVEVKNGELKLSKKCDGDLSNDERTRPIVADELVGTIDPVTKKKIQQGRGLCSNSEWLKMVRGQWADIQNASLAHHNLLPVTHKSYKDLGTNLKPTMHLGKNANHLENMDIRTRIGKHNESVNEQNRNYIEYVTNYFTHFTNQIISFNERAAVEVNKINADQARSAQHRSEYRTDRTIEFKQRVECRERQAGRVDSIIKNRVRPTNRNVPNLFTDRARRRKQRVAELSEQAENFDRETNEYNNQTADAASRLAERCTIEFLQKDTEKFDTRQVCMLNDFANKYSLTLENSKDYRQYMRDVSKFFEDININENREIIGLLVDPQGESIEYEKIAVLTSESMQMQTLELEISTSALQPSNKLRRP